MKQFKSQMKRLRTWIQQRRCDHAWRPALTSKGPVRHCGRCDRTEDLSVAEFYARFGRMPIL